MKSPSQTRRVSTRRRVVVIHRYFWPDAPPYASMLRGIAAHWIDQGDDVEVITAQPSYRAGMSGRPRREFLDKLPVQRVPVVSEAGRIPVAKLLNLVAFPLAVGAALWRADRPDVIMCSTAPQVTLGSVVSRVARRRGARFVYHCMDLHPEIGRLSGEFANPLIYRILMASDTATMRRADAVVVLSKDMKDAVVKRDPSLEPKVRVLNNFELPTFDDHRAASPLPAPAENTLRVVFTGNIGRFQGLQKVVKGLAAAAGPVDIEFILMGDGTAKAELQRLAEQVSAPSFRVRFIPQGSPEAAKALMASAHLGVVSLQPDVINYAYPSKTATYAGVGLPLLVVCEHDSELTNTVVAHRLGWAAWSQEEITDSMKEAARTLLDPPMRADLIGRVRAYAGEQFDQSTVLRRWDALLSDITGAARV